MADSYTKLVRVYSVPKSEDCERATKLLEDKKIDFVELTFESCPQAANSNNAPEWPLIFFQSSLITCYEELQRLASNEAEWEKMTRAPASTFGGPPTAACSSTTTDEPVLLCIPDEYSRIVKEMKKMRVLKSERTAYQQKAVNYFRGQDLCDFLMESKNLTIPEAVRKSQDLLDGNIGHPLSGVDQIYDPKRIYQIQESEDGDVLNAGKTYCDEISAGAFNHELVQILDSIYDKILSPDRRIVYLNRLDCSPEFKKFLFFIKEAQNISLENSSYDERLALFLNLFNIMIIHIVAKHGPPVDVWQRRKFYYSLYYVISNHRFSLQAIFNGILRGNRKGLGMLWKPFAKIDNRLKWALPNCNPLIHFAINGFTLHTCPIYTYDAQDPIAYIEMNTKATLQTDKMIKIDPRKNVIRLSKVFKWYGSDFGEDIEEILEWIYEKIDDKEKKKLFLQVYTSGKYSVEYLHFDWTINFEHERQEIAKHYVTG